MLDLIVGKKERKKIKEKRETERSDDSSMLPGYQDKQNVKRLVKQVSQQDD